MKLVIKEYLSSLRERGELDVLLPDLLSQMGLRVFSRPSRGTRQFGVDIAAVGVIEGDVEKVYLLSVKSGNLGRQDWDSVSPQSLRPSLNEIYDVYIPTHLPSEYKKLPINICICLGGDIEESVRLNISQFEAAKTTENISIVEWDGDHLSAWIEEYFLQEHLLPEGARPLLRKSLAMLDEPQSSFSYFAKLLRRLTQHETATETQVLTSLRQMNICLWILFAWARDVDNLESTFIAAERTLLYSWEIAKTYLPQQTKVPSEIRSTFNSIYTTYQLINHAYFSKILPHIDKKHGLSTAVNSSNRIDINLKLFEVLGRLALAGLWRHWHLFTAKDSQGEYLQYKQEKLLIANSIKELVNNNPTLLLPATDDSAIDISLAIQFLSLSEGNEEDIIYYLTQIFDRSMFSYQCHGMYPCIYTDYSALLDHPKTRNDDYRQEATAGSLLYPLIGLWAALLKNDKLYRKIQEAKEQHLAHCNFQFWYPDKHTENHWCKNDEFHGLAFSQVPIDQEADSFLHALWNECDQSNFFKELTCIRLGMWPLFLVACRHYRFPIPIDFTLGYRNSKENLDDESRLFLDKEDNAFGNDNGS